MPQYPHIVEGQGQIKCKKKYLLYKRMRGASKISTSSRACLLYLRCLLVLGKIYQKYFKVEVRWKTVY